MLRLILDTELSSNGPNLSSNTSCLRT